MDTCNPDGITSSMADDIFFVLQKCIRLEHKLSVYDNIFKNMTFCIHFSRRAFSSGNVDGACAVLNNAR